MWNKSKLLKEYAASGLKSEAAFLEGILEACEDQEFKKAVHEYRKKIEASVRGYFDDKITREYSAHVVIPLLDDPDSKHHFLGNAVAEDGTLYIDFFTNGEAGPPVLNADFLTHIPKPPVDTTKIKRKYLLDPPVEVYHKVSPFMDKELIRIIYREIVPASFQ